MVADPILLPRPVEEPKQSGVDPAAHGRPLDRVQRVPDVGLGNVGDLQPVEGSAVLLDDSRRLLHGPLSGLILLEPEPGDSLEIARLNPSWSPWDLALGELAPHPTPCVSSLRQGHGRVRSKRNSAPTTVAPKDIDGRSCCRLGQPHSEPCIALIYNVKLPPRWRLQAPDGGVCKGDPHKSHLGGHHHLAQSSKQIMAYLRRHLAG